MSVASTDPLAPHELAFDEQGLLPAVVQDGRTGEVLMLAYMSRESLERTVASGEVWFYSRSRRALWHKGATSGDRLRVRWLRVDCDADALLLGVDPVGQGACHIAGERSCFFGGVQGVSRDDEGGFGVLADLSRVIAARNRERPEGSYTTRLLEGGVDRVAKKVGEEAVEVALAAVCEEHGAGTELAAETADLLYHLLVLAERVGLSADDVFAELRNRRGSSSR